MPAGRGRIRVQGDGGVGGGGNFVVVPERPKQQRKGGEFSPVLNNRRPLQTGFATTPKGKTREARLFTSSTSGQHSTESGIDSPSSGNVARSHEEGGVRVVVRVRPLTEGEEVRGGERTMRCCNPKSLEFLSTPTIDATGALAGGGGEGGGGEGVRSYTFDLCAHEGFSQEEMFRSCGLKALLRAAVDGYAGL